MNLSLIGGSLLVQNSVFLGAGAVVFYAGMRWPRRALMLAALFLPLVLWSAAWSAGEFMAVETTSIGSPMPPRCAEDARCWAHFSQLQEKVRRDQVRTLFGALVVPLLMLAVLALLILRDRSARRQAARAQCAGEAVSAMASAVPSRAASCRYAPRPQGDAGSDDGAAGDAEDPHGRWWLPKEPEGAVQPRGQAHGDDARWMPKAFPKE